MLCLDHNKTLPTNFALFGGIKYSTDQSESSDVQQAVQKYKPTRSIGDSLLLRGSLDDISQGTLLEERTSVSFLKLERRNHYCIQVRKLVKKISNLYPLNQ